MSGSTRKIASILFLLAAIGFSSFAQGSDIVNPVSANSTLLGISRATEMAGGLITLGFGIWHFFIPSMFGWYDYLQDDPAELSRGVGASNFFLSFSLSLIGATSVAFPTLFPDSGLANTAWLWANACLWTARSIYQAVAPQGSQVPGLAQSMLAGFIVTDLLVIFSAVVSSLPK
jgi:hypothetical protein